MSLVQQYKNILDRLYRANLRRVEDEDLRTQLAEMWGSLDEDEQNMVQSYSARIRNNLIRN